MSAGHIPRFSGWVVHAELSVDGVCSQSHRAGSVDIRHARPPLTPRPGPPGPAIRLALRPDQ
jgi:hypothetical protein